MKKATPKRANLTNKAGARATPLETDVKDWLKIGWFRVTQHPKSGSQSLERTTSQ